MTSMFFFVISFIQCAAVKICIGVVRNWTGFAFCCFTVHIHIPNCLLFSIHLLLFFLAFSLLNSDTNAPIDLIYSVLEYEMNSEIDAMNLFDSTFSSFFHPCVSFCHIFFLYSLLGCHHCHWNYESDRRTWCQ